jgi:photosystem II stability/assembly factor-like uncharacterized protein
MKRFVAGAIVAVLAVLALATFAHPAAALVPNGDQGWFWQMPQPMGERLADLAFPTATSVWAVGGGRILHSTDAGVTWEVQITRGETDLLSVAFAGDQHGIVCGRRRAAGTNVPLVLITSDGGATWTEATPTGATDSLQTVSMSDADHAWISGTGGRLWTTADDGATWTKRVVGTYSGPVAAATADGSVGWAGGSAGRIWRTLDGGANWSLQTTGLAARYRVGEIECTDADHAWASAYVPSGRRVASRVLATSDGGTTWRVVFHSNTELVTDVHAVDASEAWLVSSDFSGAFQYAIGLGPLGMVSRVRRTVDGGVAWTTTTIDSSSALYALDSSGDSLCGVGAGVFTSSDGGQTWLSQTSGGSYMFMAAEAVSSTDVWAVDMAGAVLHSSDGVRWAELDLPHRWSQFLDDVSFPVADHGWVVGATAESDSHSLILGTSDGGDTWTKQTSVLSGELVGVDFVDAANGWSITDEADHAGHALQHTNDAGVTWTLQPVHAGILGLTDVDFIDSSTGWVTGQYESGEEVSGLVPGAVFRTTDGGATWSTYPLPKNTILEQLQFLDAQNGWAIAMKATSRSASMLLLHTADAGATWTNLSQFAGDMPTSLHFLNAQTGWVTINGKGVYATTDAGATWRRETDSDWTATIAASDAAHVWAFGLGDLLGTVDSSADTAPPSTFSSADNAWRSAPVTITLTPNDIGAAGLAGTEYSRDMGETWQEGTSIAFDASADHSNDGAHELLYRSTDAAGNREATQLCTVQIDTLGPKCSAPAHAIVNAGSKGILRFRADDSTSGVRRATITLSDPKGRVRRTFVKYSGNWSSEPPPTYYWLRFACDLKPGFYRITVRAVDRAGNEQVTVGHNWLHVVRRGAPKQTRPWWPSGLPDTSMGGRMSSGPVAGAIAAALGPAHSASSSSLPQVRWLARAAWARVSQQRGLRLR